MDTIGVLLQADDATDWSAAFELVDTGMAVAAKFWWLWTLIVLGWFLKWYFEAVSETGGPGLGAAIAAIPAMLKDMRQAFEWTAKRAIALATLVLLSLAWVFNVGPVGVTALASGDPIVWAVTAAGAVSSLAAFDHPAGTFANAFITLFGTFAIVKGAKILRRSAIEEFREVEGDGDGDDD